MPRPALILALTAALLAGCTGFPRLDGTISAHARRADYPRLAPIDQLIAGADDQQITDVTIGGLQARIAGLRARAARLRGPVVDPATRARMQAALDRRR